MAMTHEITTGLRHKRTQRKGRGESSGRGKTSGRGNKGSKARTGTTFKRGHEHGQTPIFRRFPKRGFSNENFERRFHVVNLSELNRFDDGATVDATVLIEAGLVPDDKQPVKVLGDGEITRKLTIVAGWYSRSAHQKITAAGGTAQNIKGEAYTPAKVKAAVDPVKKWERKQQQKASSGRKAAPAAAAAEEKPAAEKPAEEAK